MHKLVSTTLLLGTGSVIHAMRVIVLSLLLDNRDFGAVSTILLIATLFAEFGSLGFSQLIYNQRLFTPGVLNRAAVNVSRYLFAGLLIIVIMAAVTGAIIAVFTSFYVITIFLTLICAASNTMLLAACRASTSGFTHPIGFFVKSLIVLVDIAILGAGDLHIDTIALWGEVLAAPVLIAYAVRCGIVRPSRVMRRKIKALLMTNRLIAVWAVMSSVSSLVFLNQERIAGALFLSLEDMGAMSKILLIKIIAAQGAFILGAPFHRHIIGSSQAARINLFTEIRRYEPYAYGVLALLCALAVMPIQTVYRLAYTIDVSTAVAISAVVLAIIFAFNPFSILLQASGQFRKVSAINAITVALFLSFALFNHDNVAIVIASATASTIWFVLIRRGAAKLL